MIHGRGSNYYSECLKLKFKTQIEMTNSQDTISKNIEASINILEIQIDQLSQHVVAQASSSWGFIRNIIDNPKIGVARSLI